MTGGSENAAGDKSGGPPLAAQVPVGWQRNVEEGAVLYISPSGTVLRSVEEVRGYLLTDSTCKCGLECPLVLHKVFNFDPAAVVHAPSHQSGKVEEDMTKLCNHRRKVVAMAALSRSMQSSQIPLPAHGTGSITCPVDGRDQKGSVVARADIVHCTYPTQPRLNQSKPSSISSSAFPLSSPLSLLQNGTVSHPVSVLTLDQSSPLKKVPVQTLGPGMAAYAKQQRSPRPIITLPTHPHKPASPSIARLDSHIHVYQLDSSLPSSFSSPPPPPSPSAVISRVGQPYPQGATVKSPSPLSVCSSPSRALDSFSPHQRSRHSSAASTSSLSEGTPGSVLVQAVKPSPSPLPLTQPCLSSSPKLPIPPASPRTRLEGILQHYKECGVANTNTNTLRNQSNAHAPQNLTQDRRNGPAPASTPGSTAMTTTATATGMLGLPLGQILCQPKGQHQHIISNSFPASSLLSAAAKAQLASQKSQSSMEDTATVIPPLPPSLDKDQQSKVLISTLNSSLHAPIGRAQSLTAFLLPHSPSSSSLPVPMTTTTTTTTSPPALAEKTLRRKRQRRSPTVLSMLKESQMIRSVGDLPASSFLIPSSAAAIASASSSSPPLAIHNAENHLLGARLPSALPSASVPNSVLRQPESEEGKKTGFANSLSPLSSPPASSSQPLSALLQLLSMQSAQNATSNIAQSGSTAVPAASSKHMAMLPSSPAPIAPQTPQYEGQPGPHHVPHQQPQPQSPMPSLDPLPQLPPSSSQPLSLTCEDVQGAAINLKTTGNGTVLNLSRNSMAGTSTSTGTEPPFGSQSLDAMNQLPSGTCLPASSLPEKNCASKSGETGSDHSIYQTNQANHTNQNQTTDSEGPVISEDQQDLETRLLTGCDPDTGLSFHHDPATPTSADLPNTPGDPTSVMQLAESFPFMTQEQLLQLLSSNAGLPSLIPPFLGSLPLGLWTGGQPPPTTSTQPPHATNNLLTQNSPLSVLPSGLGAQGDFPLNLIGLINPPGPVLAPGPTPGLDVGEKAPGLQALLMASLLLGQNPAALMPLPGLNLELPAPQVFGDGMSLEKNPALLDSVLMGPGLLEALQALMPPADGQSLLLSAQLTPHPATPAPPPPPPPAAFLSLNPALLAAALAQAETLPNHTPSPPPHTQGTLSSPAVVSTSVSCAPLQEVCDSLSEQEKNSTQTPSFLPPLLPPGVLGDLAALGNISSLHGLLGAGSLLLPQPPSLTMPLSHNQTALNPLTCLQLSMTPTLMGEKPLALHETPPAQEDLTGPSLSQDSLLNPGHVPTLMQPSRGEEGSAAVPVSEPAPAMLDPYSSFMDTIYTSFLQVSGRGSEVGADAATLSYPALPPLLPQPSAPPALSPRRAYSVHNPDLSRLGMETTAQSPARGTPKLSEDSSTTPPPSRPAAGAAGADDDNSNNGNNNARPGDPPPPPTPLHLTYMEEAKTDGSAKVCVYSNGISSAGAGPGGRDDDDDEDEEDEEEEERQMQGYFSPGERGNHGDTVDGNMGNVDQEQSRASELRTGVRRGRKRKQTLQRGAETPGEIDSIMQEPAATTALSRPVRPVRGKRRRVVR